MFTSDQISIRITPCTDQEACLCNVLNITSTVSSLVECSSAMVFQHMIVYCSSMYLINIYAYLLDLFPGPALAPPLLMCLSLAVLCTEWAAENEAIHVYMQITTHVPSRPLYSPPPPPPPPHEAGQGRGEREPGYSFESEPRPRHRSVLLWQGVLHRRAVGMDRPG